MRISVKKTGSSLKFSRIIGLVCLRCMNARARNILK